jgi:hypothetical protein
MDSTASLPATTVSHGIPSAALCTGSAASGGTYTSPAQVAANRTNAQLSTGPRTPEGKARIAQNARKHGLFARDTNLACEPLGEDAAEFDQLLADLLADFAPEGRGEDLMVRKMAALTWRLGRIQYESHQSLVESLAEGTATSDAVKQSEALAPAEGRLLRALSRLQRDLAFSQRYRVARAERLAKSRVRDERQEAKQEVDDCMAALNAETERLLQNARLQHFQATRDTKARPNGKSLESPENRQSTNAAPKRASIPPRDEKNLTPTAVIHESDQRLAVKSAKQSQSAQTGQAA